jgi:hypothetical protein
MVAPPGEVMVVTPVGLAGSPLAESGALSESEVEAEAVDRSDSATTGRAKCIMYMYIAGNNERRKKAGRK